MMHVEIDHGGARDAVFALGVARRDRGMVEKAKAHRLVGLGVVAGRAHREKGIVGRARHHRVGGGNRAADAAHHRFPRSRRHRGVAVEIDQALVWRDAPELFDIMLVVAKPHQLKRAFGSFFPHQLVEAAFS